MNAKMRKLYQTADFSKVDFKKARKLICERYKFKPKHVSDDYIKGCLFDMAYYRHEEKEYKGDPKYTLFVNNCETLFPVIKWPRTVSRILCPRCKGQSKDIGSCGGGTRERVCKQCGHYFIHDPLLPKYAMMGLILGCLSSK